MPTLPGPPWLTQLHKSLVSVAKDVLYVLQQGSTTLILEIDRPVGFHFFDLARLILASNSGQGLLCWSEKLWAC